VLSIVPKPVNNDPNTGNGKSYPDFMTDDALTWAAGFSDISNPIRARPEGRVDSSDNQKGRWD
jgi:hypothetical protein